MNEYAATRAVEKLLNVLEEILAEVRAMRKEYREGQAVYMEDIGEPIDLSSIIEFNKSYEG